jgi:hypothetical protein
MCRMLAGGVCPSDPGSEMEAKEALDPPFLAFLQKVSLEMLLDTALSQKLLGDLPTNKLQIESKVVDVIHAHMHVNRAWPTQWHLAR